MYNIVICEDNEDDSKLLCDAVLSYFSERNLTCNIKVFRSGEGLISHMNSYSWDIVFCDVEMGKLDGIEAAKQLRAYDKNVKIIFVTRHASFVFHSFTAEPLNYIIKPIRTSVLMEVLDKAIERIKEEHGEAFVISFDNVVYHIPLSTIIYFESSLRIINIITTNGSYKYYSKLNDIEIKMKKKDFIRCHQSYIINLRHVKQIENDKILMSNDEWIDISRSRRKEVKEKMLDYVGNTIIC